MSAKDDWMLELDGILAAFSSPATLLLQTTQRCYATSGQSFNEEFKEYFLHVSNEIMAIMYSKFELGLLLNVGRIDPNGLRGIRQFQTNKVVSDSPANSASDEPNTLPILNLELIKTEAEIEIVENEVDSLVDTNEDDSLSNDENVEVYVEPKVEEVDGDAAAMAFQFNFELDETLNCLIEENPDEQETGEMANDGDLLCPMNQQSNTNHAAGSSKVEIAAGEQKPSTIALDTKRMMLKSKVSAKTTGKGAKPPKKRQKLRLLKPKGVRVKKESYQCYVCSKNYDRSDNFRLHLAVHVSKQYQFYCIACAIGFEQEIDKIAHDRVCRRRRYECHICKGFFTPYKPALQRHLLKHTKGR